MATDLIPSIEFITSTKVGIHDKNNTVDEYVRIGDHIVDRLKDEVFLTPHSRILDIGCGPGRVTRALSNVLTTGSYAGIDVTRESIEWCKEKYAAFPNFTFIHADLFNKWYNPLAKAPASEYRFPFPDDHFNIAFSSSLFTHMLIDGVDNYLGEMSRVLSPGGYVWNSYRPSGRDIRALGTRAPLGWPANAI